MAREISNKDDVIDSRDVIERIEELESEEADLIAATEPDDCADYRPSAIDELEQWRDDYAAELRALKALADEASASPDWDYGEMLIRDSYFVEYAQQLADDLGFRPEGWPASYIDWEAAARDLKMDYFSVDFNGVEYWIRS